MAASARVSSASPSSSARRAPWVHRSAHATRTSSRVNAARSRVSPADPTSSRRAVATSAVLGATRRSVPSRRAATLSRVTPSARARWAQVSRSSTSSTSSLSRLVFRHAASLALGPDRPVRSSSASIAFLRCEKLRSSSRSKPRARTGRAGPSGAIGHRSPLPVREARRDRSKPPLVGAGRSCGSRARSIARRFLLRDCRRSHACGAADRARARRGGQSRRWRAPH